MDYQLWLGDCLEEMGSIPDGSIDAIIADLPYGTTACKWDVVIPFEPLWKHYKRVIKRNGAIVLFGSEPFSSLLRLSNLDWYKYDWVWDKVLPTNFLNAKNKPMKRHEIISVFSSASTANGSQDMMSYHPQMWQSTPYIKTLGKDPRMGAWDKGNRKPFELNPITSNGERYPVSILQFSNANRVNKLHPTQKPVALLEYLIKTYTNENETVLDNTMGSGSTGEACLRTGRKFIGIEKHKPYFDVAKSRLEKVAAELRGELNHLPIFQEIAA